MESILDNSLLLFQLGVTIGILIYYITYNKPHRFKKKDKIEPKC